MFSDMIILIKVYSSTSSDITTEYFSVRKDDIKQIEEGGIIQSTGKAYSIVTTKSYEENSFTIEHKILGSVVDITNMINGFASFPK